LLDILINNSLDNIMGKWI